MHRTLPIVPQMIGCYLFLLFCSIIPSQPSSDIYQQLQPFVSNGSVLLHDEKGNEIVSISAQKKLIPASILKILTSMVAFESLGHAYTFNTEVYIDSAHNMLIKGLGDPFFVSEEIDLLCKELLKKGLSTIQTLYLDNSSFATDITIPGISRTLNPYDAINGALVVNFNTLNLGKDSKGLVYSAEEATPLTPLALTKAKHLKNGVTERISLLDNKAECLNYAAELCMALFQKNAIVVKEHQYAVTPPKHSWTLFHTHVNTRPLDTIVKELNKYSNNFIANQLFLTIGAQTYGYPATLEKGRNVFREYLQKHYNHHADQAYVAEGSGISRDNKITGTLMISILEDFKTYAMLLSPKNGALVKSGTLNGVFNYAGYIQSEKGLLPFVIMLNQPHNTRDKILSILVSYAKKK